VQKTETVGERHILNCILFKFTKALINTIIDGTPSAHRWHTVGTPSAHRRHTVGTPSAHRRHITTICSHENLGLSKYGELKSKFSLFPPFLEVLGNAAIRLLYRHKDS